MTGIRLAASIGVTLCALHLGASAALAEIIPLPTPAPAPKDYSKPAPAPSSTTTQSTVPPPAASSPPALSGITDALGNAVGKLNPWNWHQSSDLSLFDAKQRALVNRVSNYLTSVQTLTGNFVQIGPDGRRSTGHLFLQKPGRVRFEYDPPATVEIVADGSQVVVHDKQLGTNDAYPLSQTPLRFLLADRIDLLQDTNVVGVTADDVFVSVIIEEKQPFVGTNRLTMMFDSKDFKLKQWTITDVQGFDTTIAVSNLDSKKVPDPNLFRIESARLVQ